MDAIGILLGGGTALAGGLIGVLGALIVQVISGRQAHYRWLRDKRLAAYVESQSLISELDFLQSRMERLEANEARMTRKERHRAVVEVKNLGDKLTARFHAANSHLVILGPDSVRTASKTLAHSLGNEAERDQAQRAFQDAAEEAIGIRKTRLRERIL